MRQQLHTGAAGCCVLLWSLAVLAADSATTTVYRSVGPNGVVSFSDAPNPSAVPIEVMPPPMPLEAEVERANDIYERQLALLEFLETAHQARVAQAQAQQRLDLDYVRTAAELERARASQEPQEDTRYYPIFSPWFWGSGPRPPGGHRPPMERPQKPPPPQQIQFPHRP